MTTITIKIPQTMERSQVSASTPSPSELLFIRAYYTPGFFTATWTKAVLAGAIAVAAIVYAPEPSKEAYITRWIAMWKTPSSVWSEINDKHTALSVDASKERLFLNSAEKPVIHRLEFPQYVVLL